VRVVLDRALASAGGARHTRAGSPTGASYLARKKAARDATVELERRAKKVVREVYGALGSQSDGARRRAASELPSGGGPLLLDAAFLVPRTRAARFRSAVGRQARTLGPHGYRISLSGPWPPYSFLQG
jgi:gas vesicle protein GvpL/GvpF